MLKKKLFSALALILTAILFAVGTVCWGDTGKVALRPEGYMLTSEAYVVPVADGRDTVAMMESQAAEIGVLRRYITSQDSIIDAISTDIFALDRARVQERAAWSSGMEKLKMLNERLRSPWSVGAFAGYNAVRREACIGIGITYSLFRF